MFVFKTYQSFHCTANYNIFFIVCCRLNFAVEASGGDVSKLLTAAKTERMLLQTYDIRLPTHLEKTAKSLTDTTAVNILQKLQPTVLAYHTPLQMFVDGNCGHEDLHFLIRLLTTIELCEHRQFYYTDAFDYIALIKDHCLVSDPYLHLMSDATKPGLYSEMLHVFAASAALHLALTSHCPQVMIQDHLSGQLNRTVRGHGVHKSSAPAFILMWSQMTVPKDHRCFRPNHFILLHENCPSEDIIDLTTPTGHSTPMKDADWPSLPLSAGVSPVTSPYMYISNATY